MKIKSFQLSLVIAIFFILGIVGSMAFNIWQTESSKIPAKIKEGKFAGEFDPGDIRGSYSLQDVSNNFNISVDLLAEVFGFENVDNPGSVQIKEFESIYEVVDQGEVGTDSMRVFVSLYNGIPYTPEHDTLIPSKSIQYLKEKLDEDTLAYALSISINLNQLRKVVSQNLDTDEEHEEELGIVKGKTTFGDLLDWGLTDNEIINIVGGTGKTGETIRDYATSNGLTFSSIKTELQKILDLNK